ncbi:hypothetical protein CsSME_00044778 [Camellia sinensis var. sinensis]
MKSSSLHQISLAALFTLLHCTTIMNSCLVNNTNNNTEYITKSCATMLYPQLCYKSLSKYANKIQSSPKILAITALSVSLFAAQSTSKLMSNLSKTPNLRSGEAATLADCVEVMGDSVDELQRSVDELTRSRGDFDFEFKMSNAKTWVSVALTNDDTCMDGFGGMAMNGQVKSIVRRFVKKLAHLTSNWLALVNNYASSQDHHTLKEIPKNKAMLFLMTAFAVLPTISFNVYNVYKGVQARKGSMLVGFGNGVKEFEARWIGWAGVNVPNEAGQRALTKALAEKRCIHVFLDEEIVHQCYNGYFNNILWPLFHYLGLLQEDRLVTTRSFQSQFVAYVKANVMFAAVVNQHYQEGHVVWCHDYHLMFLPKMPEGAQQ